MAVFADAFYYIALRVPEDAGHERALELSGVFAGEEQVTSDPVLVEVLAYVARRGRRRGSRPSV